MMILEYQRIRLVLYMEDFDGGENICIAWKCSLTSNKIHNQKLSPLLPAGICQKHLEF